MTPIFVCVPSLPYHVQRVQAADGWVGCLTSFAVELGLYCPYSRYN